MSKPEGRTVMLDEVWVLLHEPARVELGYGNALDTCTQWWQLWYNYFVRNTILKTREIIQTTLVAILSNDLVDIGRIKFYA